MAGVAPDQLLTSGLGAVLEGGLEAVTLLLLTSSAAVDLDAREITQRRVFGHGAARR